MHTHKTQIKEKKRKGNLQEILLCLRKRQINAHTHTIAITTIPLADTLSHTRTAVAAANTQCADSGSLLSCIRIYTYKHIWYAHTPHQLNRTPTRFVKVDKQT